MERRGETQRWALSSLKGLRGQIRAPLVRTRTRTRTPLAHFLAPNRPPRFFSCFRRGGPSHHTTHPLAFDEDRRVGVFPPTWVFARRSDSTLRVYASSYSSPFGSTRVGSSHRSVVARRIWPGRRSSKSERNQGKPSPTTRDKISFTRVVRGRVGQPWIPLDSFAIASISMVSVGQIARPRCAPRDPQCHCFIGFYSGFTCPNETPVAGLSSRSTSRSPFPRSPQPVPFRRIATVSSTWRAATGPSCTTGCWA